MKLLSLASRYYLIALVLVFLVGSVMAYFVLRSIINSQFNQKLMAEQQQLVYELHNYEDLKETYYLNIGDRIDLTEVDVDPAIAPSLRDTVMYDPYERRELPFRILKFSDEFNGRYYVITIAKSLLPSQDLIRGISEIMLALVSVLAITLVVLNRVISKRLWQPFYTLLDQLRKFNITSPKAVRLASGRIAEFEELRRVAQSMMDKTVKDYQNLKEYTENASHEIQTPLAIIKAKSEILLQEQLSPGQMKEVARIYEAATRLSKLKDSLATLNKIENNQYANAEPVNIRDFVISKLDDMEDLVTFKKLKVETTYHAAPVVILNSTLAYMLITNLLSNAIRHNIANGRINLTLKENELMIKNTGPELAVPPEELFGRFRRSGRSGESTGLGLSIVQRISELYNMKVKYSYSNGWHKVVLNF